MIGVLVGDLNVEHEPLYKWLDEFGIKYGKIRSITYMNKNWTGFILPGHKLGSPSERYWKWASQLIEQADTKPILGICEGFYTLMRRELGRNFRPGESYRLKSAQFNYRGQSHKHMMAFHKGLLANTKFKEIPTSLPFINTIKHREKPWIGIAWHPEISSDYYRAKIAKLVKSWV